MNQPKAVFAFDHPRSRPINTLAGVKRITHPDLPGVDLTDLHQAGWQLVSFGHPVDGYEVTFRNDAQDVTWTVRGDGYPAAVENFRRELWREGQLALRDVSTPDDIRARGWTVAVHNDYRLHGEVHTFWLFTKGNLCVKGEGRSDAGALDQVRSEITRLEAAL